MAKKQQQGIFFFNFLQAKKKFCSGKKKVFPSVESSGGPRVEGYFFYFLLLEYK